MSCSDSDDDLVSYGTPLEPLEEDEIPNKKPRLIEDQVVTDKQGRRRFHGAFTGGFSAGFFNTVGSLEGWAPSSFKSSKSKKHEVFQQTPEDFMDEEDMSEFGIAPVVLKARQHYAVEINKNVSAVSECQTIGTYVLQDLLKHVRETIGIKLLKKMGWKPGQGVGPRLNKNEKQKCLNIRQKTYGCQLPPGSLEENENKSDSEWDDIEFAPSDYEPFVCETKSNFNGLGYEGLDKGPLLSINSPLKREDNLEIKKKKLGFRSQAFGVGVFEEEDEDIYEKDDMSRYNFFLTKDESADLNKPADRNSHAVEGVLGGFVKETKAHIKKNYPLPTLPKDFKPHHRIRSSRFDQPPSNSELRVEKGNYEDRRKVLEKPSEKIGDGKKREEKNAITLISDVKINEIRFRPFVSIPEKQERYENYLKLIKIGKKELLSDLQPFTMTEWDKEREKVEFEKAALLFRPLEGGMEDRFSTASQSDDLSDPLAPVEKFLDESDDRTKAAKMKMFGPLTRRTQEWIPSSQLCKRFNIPEPKKCNNTQSFGKAKEKPSYFNLFDCVQNLREDTGKIEPQTSSHERRHEEEPETFETSQSNEENINDASDKTDLFKAIFLASDDDEEKCSAEVNKNENIRGDLDSNKNLEKKEKDDAEILFEDRLINSKRNSSPPKGIFENIDLELLSGLKKKEFSGSENCLKKEKSEESKEILHRNVLSLNLVYGPQIPEKVEVKSGFVSRDPLEDDGIWVEKTTRDGKKHKKKDKKRKKTSHKAKRKHKSKR